MELHVEYSQIKEENNNLFPPLQYSSIFISTQTLDWTIVIGKGLSMELIEKSTGISSTHWFILEKQMQSQSSLNNQWDMDKLKDKYLTFSQLNANRNRNRISGRRGQCNNKLGTEVLWTSDKRMLRKQKKLHLQILNSAQKNRISSHVVLIAFSLLLAIQISAEILGKIKLQSHTTHLFYKQSPEDTLKF